MIRLGRGVAGAKVRKARYGVLDDPKRTRDVREKLQRLLDAGENSFPVARLAAGRRSCLWHREDARSGIHPGRQYLHLGGTDPEMLDFVAGPASANCGRPSPLRHRRPRPPGSLASPAITNSSPLRGNHAASRSSPSQPPVELNGPWEVRFDPKWGGPERVAFAQLQDWSMRPEDGIRYYSGTAIYRTTFAWQPQDRPARAALDSLPGSWPGGGDGRGETQWP